MIKVNEFVIKAKDENIQFRFHYYRRNDVLIQFKKNVLDCFGKRVTKIHFVFLK